MSTRKKQVKKFRVVCAGRYCSLRTDFNPLGTIHPDTDRDGAHVFDTSVMAKNCIARTSAARSDVSGSLYPNHPMFKPLFFDGAPTVEEFLVEA